MDSLNAHGDSQAIYEALIANGYPTTPGLCRNWGPPAERVLNVSCVGRRRGVYRRKALTLTVAVMMSPAIVLKQSLSILLLVVLLAQSASLAPLARDCVSLSATLTFLNPPSTSAGSGCGSPTGCAVDGYNVFFDPTLGVLSASLLWQQYGYRYAPVFTLNATDGSMVVCPSLRVPNCDYCSKISNTRFSCDADNYKWFISIAY